MNDKVTSVRLTNSTILDIYNFISINCSCDVANIPESRVISTFITITLDWMKKNGIDLPGYEDEDAVLKELVKIQGKSISLKRLNVKHNTTFKPYSKRMIESNVEILHNNSNQNEQAVHHEIIDYKKEKAIIKEQEQVKKDNMVSMIEDFQEQLNEKNVSEMINAITMPVIIKKE